MSSKLYHCYWCPIEYWTDNQVPTRRYWYPKNKLLVVYTDIPPASSTFFSDYLMKGKRKEYYHCETLAEAFPDVEIS